MKKAIYTLKIFFLATLMFCPSSEADAQRKTTKRQPAIQKATIYVENSGYAAPNVTLKRGVPARITIIRRSEYECGEEIVFPAFNIRRKLPLNKPVVVNFTPKRRGSLDFTCGMDMMRGKLIVN